MVANHMYRGPDCSFVIKRREMHGFKAIARYDADMAKFVMEVVT